MISVQKSNGVKTETLAKPFSIGKFPQKILDRSADNIKKSGTEHLQEELKEPPSREELEEILKLAGQIIFGNDTHYEFKLHEKTGTMMCKLVNNETNETVSEIPSEKILDVVAGIWELVGIIVDEKG
ncbi:MAG: flagellar protein FlaG [Peptostreptococcaceae bacterium]|nr:flagellar protein FlaG [Peptostreptococcaceae bacterium]